MKFHRTIIILIISLLSLYLKAVREPIFVFLEGLIEDLKSDAFYFLHPLYSMLEVDFAGDILRRSFGGVGILKFYRINFRINY